MKLHCELYNSADTYLGQIDFQCFLNVRICYNAVPGRQEQIDIIILCKYGIKL